MTETPVAFDPARFKQQERAGFNLVAGRYEPSMRGLLGSALPELLALARLAPGQRVLDVATGPGLVARAAALAVATGGSVLGVDLAEQALALASQKAAAEGLLGLRFEPMDAEALALPDASFERAICSMGLMHFPAPDAAAREMRRVLAPGGRVAVGVWGEEGRIPFLSVALRTFLRVLPPPRFERPAMSRLGSPRVLEGLLSEAGFVEVACRRVSSTLVVADAAGYWRTFLDVAGVTTVALAKQPPELMTRLERESEAELAPYAAEGGFRLESDILLAGARRAD